MSSISIVQCIVGKQFGDFIFQCEFTAHLAPGFISKANIFEQTEVFLCRTGFRRQERFSPQSQKVLGVLSVRGSPVCSGSLLSSSSMSNSDSLSSYSTFSSSSLKSGAKALQFSWRQNGKSYLMFRIHTLLMMKHLCIPCSFIYIQPLLSRSTHHLVLSPDGHHSTGDGGDNGTDRMPLDGRQR